MPTDPLRVMNAAMQFTPEQGGAPPIDERWTRKLAILSDYAAALKDLYDVRTRQYRARCYGVVRDTALENEFLAAFNKVLHIEEFLGIADVATPPTG